MPLDEGYGVLIGTLDRYYRDSAEDHGNYYHANLQVATPEGIYRCALDVDGKSAAGLQWRVVELGQTNLRGVRRLPDGWHALDRGNRSGALDYIRSRELQPDASPSYVVIDPAIELFRRALRIAKGPTWKRGTSIDALADLEPLLGRPRRLFVYGEPFGHGRGVHNIHQNQGDPPGSRWARENGIWQDGALVVERLGGTLAAFLLKYATQADRTDRRGHPA